VATILVSFLRTNWPNLVQFKHVLMSYLGMGTGLLRPFVYATGIREVHCHLVKTRQQSWIV